jgi:hypothetical protein
MRSKDIYGHVSLIAICGGKHHGKTTLKDELIANHIDMKVMSFADPMRDMLRAIGVEDEYLIKKKTKPIHNIAGNPTARRMLTTLGTQWGRKYIHEDIWASLMRDRIKAYKSGIVSPKLIVIDDLRFPNELNVVKELGGVAVRVHRPELPKPGLRWFRHESERYYDKLKVDLEVVNYTSPFNMYTQLTTGLLQLHGYGY